MTESLLKVETVIIVITLESDVIFFSTLSQEERNEKASKFFVVKIIK